MPRFAQIRIWVVCLCLALSVGGCLVPNKRHVLRSPDKLLSLEAGLDNSGSPFYRLFMSGEVVVDTSYLGLALAQGPDLQRDFVISHVEKNIHDKIWEQPWGASRWVRDHHQELVMHLQEKRGSQRTMSIRFRVFNDGIGFRYEIPTTEGQASLGIKEELTEFKLAPIEKAWWIPAMEDNRYEYLYQTTPLDSIKLVHTPITLETKSGAFVSLHEAALAQYSSMMLEQKDGNKLVANLVPYSPQEESKAFLPLPGHTPWRTIQVAQKAGDLITSNLILNLNEPNALGDVSWFKPGKYLGIWWEMHLGLSTWGSGPNHGATTQRAKAYVDFAAEHGFDGLLIEGWNHGWDGDWTQQGDQFDFTQAHPDLNLDSLCAYADEKGVYLVGHHETAGNIDNYERQMVKAFEMLESHGARAVKTGYVEHGNLLSNDKYHHGQAYIEHFHKVIRLAAKHKVAVVAHEPIKDTGERRTYPNIVSREGARGQEFNAWSADGGNPPSHTQILPFTRMLAGPLDFTPGVFDLELPTRPDNQVQTTLAKQLALYVTLYAPLQMACDLPEHYMRYPEAFAFIKEVGVDWDTTLVIEAAIEEFLVMARKERGSDRWFLGATTNEAARSLSINLDFLPTDKPFQATVYADAPEAHYKNNPEAHQITTQVVRKGDKMSLQLAPGGGTAISLIPLPKDLLSTAP